jgi:hypothetical protein
MSTLAGKILVAANLLPVTPLQTKLGREQSSKAGGPHAPLSSLDHRAGEWT